MRNSPQRRPSFWPDPAGDPPLAAHLDRPATAGPVIGGPASTMDQPRRERLQTPARRLRTSGVRPAIFAALVGFALVSAACDGANLPSGLGSNLPSGLPSLGPLP